MIKKSAQLFILVASCAAVSCTSSTAPSTLGQASAPAAIAAAANATVGSRDKGPAPSPAPTLPPLPPLPFPVPPSPLPDIAVVVKGLVSELLGQCPNRTFVMGNRLVITSRETVYTAGACEALVFSQRLDVTGIEQGFILRALEIRQQKNKDRP